MIKTYLSTREVPCVSVFLCITSSVACQSDGANKNRDNIAPEFVLNVIWLYFLKRNKMRFFFLISSLPNSLHPLKLWEEGRAHCTRQTAYLLSNHAAALQLMTLLSSFWIKKEITWESCCGLRRRPIIRRSVLLQILIKLWQLIWLALILDSILLNGWQPLTTTAEPCIIYKHNLKHKIVMAEHTILGMAGDLLGDRAWFPLSYLPVQEVFEVFLRDMVQGASINLYWPLSGFPSPIIHTV